MTKIRRTVFFLFVTAISCTYDKGVVPLCDNVNSSYSQSIRPIMESKCAISGCHDGSSYTGNFNMYNEIKNWVDNGIFKVKVIDSKQMPPPTQPPLSDKEYQQIKCWVEKGALNN